MASRARMSVLLNRILLKLRRPLNSLLLLLCLSGSLHLNLAELLRLLLWLLLLLDLLLVVLGRNNHARRR